MEWKTSPCETPRVDAHENVLPIPNVSTNKGDVSLTINQTLVRIDPKGPVVRWKLRGGNPLDESMFRIRYLIKSAIVIMSRR